MAITSNTIPTAVGDLDISIQTGTDTMEIISVSDIKYKFDINDITSDTIDGVPFIIASCNFTANDELNSGASLEDEIGSINTNVDVTIGTYTFPLVKEINSYTVDDKNGTITIELIASNSYLPGTNLPTFAPIYDTDSGTTRDLGVAVEVIESALSDFGETTFIVESTHFDATAFPQSGDPDARWGAETGAVTEMTQAAASEGSYYGIGFNNGFYVSRDSTANKVTLDENDILDASRDIAFPDLKEVTINFANNDGSFLTGEFDETDTSTVNSTFRQTLSVTATANTWTRMFYDAGDARQESDTDANSATAAQNVIATGQAAYEDVLRGSAPFTISIRVRGFDTVKPWQPFDITDTTGKLTAIAGKTYRPLELTYSIDNYIDIVAYQIA